MSAVKNQKKHSDDEQDIDIDIDIDEQERRHHADSKSRDRRVIPRLGHPEIRKTMRLSQTLCTIGVVASILYIAGLIARHIHDSNLELNRSIFFGVVMAIVAVGIQYLGSAMKSYCENESQQRLVVVSERLFKALFLFVVTGLVLGVVNVITWF